MTTENEQLREALRNHWLFEIHCNHEMNTDTPTCSCSRWACEPQPNIREAVERWIEHVFAEAALLEEVLADRKQEEQTREAPAAEAGTSFDIYGHGFPQVLIDAWERREKEFAAQLAGQTAKGATAPGLSELSVESATTIAEEIINEYKRLAREGYTHWHKRSIGRMLKAGVDAALRQPAAPSERKQP